MGRDGGEKRSRTPGLSARAAFKAVPPPLAVYSPGPRPQAGAIQLFGYRSPRITVCPTTAGTIEPAQAATHYGGGRLGASLDSISGA